MSILVLMTLLPAQFEPLSSKEFDRADQEAALRATVRIVNSAGNTDGSGVVVGQSGPFVYVLTARHVVAKADKVEVQTFEPTSWPRPTKRYTDAEIVARSEEEQDVALLRIPTRDRPSGIARFCTPRKTPTGKNFPGLSVGCTDGRAPHLHLETVAGKRTVRQPGLKGPAVFWQTSQAPTAGRSGGPLFARGGLLIGLCSAAGDDHGYYAHPDGVHAFLKSNAFRWLYDEP